ncbi:myosin-11 isoform X2 [Helicoverpa armigera]|uniref:myosin-11 isoform X2 n=1 Tax=Helicoverpa armigera TaxID=29058 RepID=UPI003082AC07
MMGVLGTEQQLCPCYKECQQQFYKLAEFKDTGLVVYCHSTRRTNVRQGEEGAVKDVFILHNTGGVKITNADLTSELEKKDISCPRCRKTLEHAQELIKKIPSIGRRNTIGVCDHCRKKAQRIKKPCFACEEIVKKFISVKGEQKEETKKDVKLWLSRMGHLLKDTMNLDNRHQTRTYSDAHINQIFIKSPKCRRELEVQQMFSPETHKSYVDIFVDTTTELKEINVPEKAVAFSQPIEPSETVVGTHVPAQEPPRTSLKEGKLEDKLDYYNKPSMDVKEAIKNKHDLSLRQMVGSGKNFRAASKRPEIYEILKIAPWEHPKTEKDHDGISEIFIKLPKAKQDLSSESSGDAESELYKLKKYGSRTSQKESKRKPLEYAADTKFNAKETGKRKHPTSKISSQKSLRGTRSERVGKYDHGKLNKEISESELIFQKIKRDEYHLHDKEFKSEQGVAKVTGQKSIGPKDNVERKLKHQFSFYFPKKVQKHKKQFKVRSSELIKTTQEKILQQAEDAQKRLEVEQQQKQEVHEKKMLAEKGKTQQDEEIRQSIKDEKEDIRMTVERSFEDLESKSLAEREKQDRARDLSKEDKYKRDTMSDSGLFEKDLKQRTQPRDKMETDRELEKSRRGLKSKSDTRDTYADETDKAKRESSKTERELEKSKRGLKSKSDTRDTYADETDKAKRESSKTERELEKSKRGLKSKSDTRDTYADETDKAKGESSKTERELEKSKRGLKSKSETRGTYDDETDKARRESFKTERQLEKSKRGLKSKSDTRGTYDDEADKARRELSSKTERELEKSKRAIKSKTDTRDTYEDEKDKAKREQSYKTDRDLEKSKRGIKSKTDTRDTYDDEKDKAKREQSYKTDRDLEKSKRDIKSKTDTRDTNDYETDKARRELSPKTDRELEKSKKGTKSKTDTKDIYDKRTDKERREPSSKTDKESEKSKRDIKSKTDTKDAYDDGTDKNRKELSSETDRELERSKKGVKSKSDSKHTYDDGTDKARKELSSKTDRDLEKSKRGIKSKSDTRDTYDDGTDKERKELSSKPDKELDKFFLSFKSKSDKRDIYDDGIDKERKELSSKSKRELKSKSDKRDTYDDTIDKSKKEISSKTDKQDKYDEVSEKAKKGSKAKSGLGDKSEEALRKEKETKKDYKIKPEKDTEVEVSMRSEPKEKGFEVQEKGKKGIKEKYESTGKDGEITAKSRKEVTDKPGLKGKHEDIPDLSKKYPKLKRESDSDIEITLKSKTGQQAIKSDSQLKKDLKEKSERVKKAEDKKDFQEEHKDKNAKEKKPEKKDWNKDMDKEMATALKNKEKQELDEKLQRDKEEKEMRELIERKDKENQKKPSTKEAAEMPRKSIKEKETLKKSEKPSKAQKSSEIDISMTKIKVKDPNASENIKLSTTQQDSKKKKGETPGEMQESSRKESKKAETSKEPIDESSKKEEASKEDAKKKAKESADEAEFRKLQAKLKKEKEEALKQKKIEEAEARKITELAEKRAKEEAERKKSEKAPKSIEPQLSEESTPRLIKINPADVDPKVVRAHRNHYRCGHDSQTCILCFDSDLEIDVESYDNKLNRKKADITDIIIGEYILKYKPRREIIQETNVPLLFKSKFIEESNLQPSKELVTVPTGVDELENKPVLPTVMAKKGANVIDPEPAKGIVRYALSDRTFIDKGWTMLPTEKVVRKMNVYRMRPAHPEFDWFEHNKNKRLMTYDTGERLAEFDDNGRGRWYYRSGRLALDYYDAEETNAQQRFVIYSSGEPDERGRSYPITILATFDYLGNGIVFDHAGKIRLKYNQTEGVVLDRGIGPVSHWKWHTLNDPPVLQQVMIDTQMAHKDPQILKLGAAADTKVRPDNEEMLAIEFDNFIKEKSKKLSQKFKPFQIKMKALKINEHFSLKVLDQATIYLIFRDGTTNLKLNIGMILDHQEIVDTDTAEVGEVSNNLERFPARTDSLAGLQRSVAYAQRYERQRTERERRLRPPEPCASADHLMAAVSAPLRPPLRTLPTASTTSAGYCPCRKPSSNLYYNTRLL